MPSHILTPEEQNLLANIGDILRGFREEAGMTQRQAAQRSSSTQARLSDIENAKADLMLTTIRRWAAVYGYDVVINFVPQENEFDKALREAAEELAAECDCPAHEYLGRECTCYCVHTKER